MQFFLSIRVASRIGRRRGLRPAPNSYFRNEISISRKNPSIDSRVPGTAAANAKANTREEPARMEIEAMTMEIWSKTSA